MFQFSEYELRRLVRVDSTTGAVTLNRQALPKAADSIFFGRGNAVTAFPSEVARIAAGRPVMLVAGATSSRSPAIAQALTALKERVPVACTLLVHGRATSEVVAGGMALAIEHQVSTVAMVGGGTVIDVGKAVAALCRQPGAEPTPDYVDRMTAIADGIDPSFVVPWCAVPTTSGTGSESTYNSVLEMGDVKVSLKGIPPASLIVADPAPVAETPHRAARVAACDALSQAMEVLCSGHTPHEAQVLAAWAIKALSAGIDALDADPNAAADHLCWGSLLMGIAFAHGRLGLPHALAHYCLKYGLSHGQMVAGLLAPGLRVQAKDPEVRARLEALAALLGVDDSISWAQRTTDRLLRSAGLAATLAEAGISRDEMEWIAQRELELVPQIGVPPRPATFAELMEALENSR